MMNDLSYQIEIGDQILNKQMIGNAISSAHTTGNRKPGEGIKGLHSTMDPEPNTMTHSANFDAYKRPVPLEQQNHWYMHSVPMTNTPGYTPTNAQSGPTQRSLSNAVASAGQNMAGDPSVYERAARQHKALANNAKERRKASVHTIDQVDNRQNPP